MLESSPLIIPLAAVCAYLLGSIPFAVVSSKIFGLADPRSYGSGNPGATNVLRSGSKRAAICTLIGDSMKGWLAVFLARTLAFTPSVVGIVALAVFLGHVFPIFLKFKGGKGVATAVGILLALDVSLGLAAFGCWLLVLLLWRTVSLASVAAAITAPVVAFFFQREYALPVVLLAALLIARHAQNLRRLVAGDEPKIGARKREG
ncbi:MAG: glycerol-3-phosphate 1-O-acyltransferase PlsY [Candidatus Accumulibacter sp.]|jgi:glycerol-3-phosphate acyltransferase PlsY|nr:glycerol-3-phosphate 1-O-acyltransferase PlsY [Accumulibacter sp.]